MLETTKVKINHGPHSGKLFTRLPVKYLREMLVSREPMWEYAESELRRRGLFSEFNVRVTRHAVDRASLFCITLWQKTREDNQEGLYSWLMRITDKLISRFRKSQEKEEITFGKSNEKKLKLKFEDFTFIIGDSIGGKGKKFLEPTLITILPPKDNLSEMAEGVTFDELIFENKNIFEEE